MKYIICFAIVGIILLAYRSDNHKHIWVSLVRDTVVMDEPEMSTTLEGRIWPTGKQPGMEIVCVKCFAKKRQIIDYGVSSVGNYIQFPAGLDTLIFSSGQSTLGTSAPIFINMQDTVIRRTPGK